jgi:mercuric ion transport protein
MIFFFFSFLASLVGGISAGNLFNISLGIQLSIDNPFAGIITFWPFIVALLVLLLSILWYQALKNMKRNKAQVGRKHRFGAQSTVYMSIVTVFVLILIATPYLISRFGQEYVNSANADSENRVETVITVHGMDCTGCEGLVNKNVAKIDGVETVTASFQREEVLVVYDKSKASLKQIAEAIENSGYTVVME